MTEGCEEKDSLVRVRAQVMTRDDSSGGWVPMDGGGLSNVSVRKRILPIHAAIVAAVTSSSHNNSRNNNNPASNNNSASSRSSSTSGGGPGPPPPPHHSPAPPHSSSSAAVIPVYHCNSLIQQHEYLILGKRISDQTVVLSCTIRKDFQYNKVMPTFHHWRTGDQKFGLTFQTAADARAFDKGVRMAVEDLLNGLADAPPALRHMNSDASEDDVFMTLDLPMERTDLQRSPTLNHHQQQQQQQANQPPPPPSPVVPVPPPPTSNNAPLPPLPKEPHLHRIHFMQRRPLPPSSSTSSLPLLNNSITEGLNKEHSISPEQLMWQQRDQELALTRERERATKEKERQRREREGGGIGGGGVGGGMWPPGIGGIGVLNDHIELDKESYSYVQFAREGNTGVALHSLHSLHEYSYPVMPDPATPKPSQSVTVAPARRDSLSSLKKNPMTSVNSCSSMATTAPMLPSKAGRGGNGKKKRRGSNSSSSSTKAMSISHLHPPGKGSTGRVRCKHCQDTYRPEENYRGACDHAPDCVRSTIDAVSCVSCAECLMYHCYADAEGDFAPQPCVCGSGSVRRHNGSGCCSIESSPKRWFGLALLSLVVPCLWCYLPLRACYRCGVRCGCCGKPHEPAA
ncbi:protein sprouty-like isoform X2 [Daphnia pulicaria]|uniref:protein sprouty-like isoform X2 n=1 Tax=Daphnia pulicaria TaxID=35523 RepID=UPI001EEC5A77|nr:protein sprouty-like isoform X2 [Daphnia pulicaria]